MYLFYVLYKSQLLLSVPSSSLPMLINCHTCVMVSMLNLKCGKFRFYPVGSNQRLYLIFDASVHTALKNAKADWLAFGMLCLSELSCLHADLFWWASTKTCLYLIVYLIPVKVYLRTVFAVNLGWLVFRLGMMYFMIISCFIYIFMKATNPNFWNQSEFNSYTSNTCSEVLVICFQMNVLTFQFKISQLPKWCIY